MNECACEGAGKCDVCYYKKCCSCREDEGIIESDSDEDPLTGMTDKWCQECYDLGHCYICQSSRGRLRSCKKCDKPVCMYHWIRIREDYWNWYCESCYKSLFDYDSYD